MKLTSKICLISFLSLSLNACSFFDKDNTPPPTPLTGFKTEAYPKLLWYTSTGSGVGNNYVKLVPAVNSTKVFTADQKGHVTATDKRNGDKIWATKVTQPITSGPAADENIVVIGCRNGELVALDQATGNPLWTAHTTTEILAAPAVKNGITVVKAINGRITAYNNQTGKELWSTQQTEPNLILRGGSAPQLSANSVVAGFANGTLMKFSQYNGSVEWQQTIATPEGAFAIQRMVDIDADPLLFDGRVYAATYQGRITAMNLNSGETLWTRNMSSFTGITADPQRVYVTDAKSYVWAFDANSGQADWTQTQLESRNTTSPASVGNMIVVGDSEGYLHWMDKQDGHFTGRVKVNGSGMIAGPVVDNGIIYVATKDGHLAAYTL